MSFIRYLIQKKSFNDKVQQQSPSKCKYEGSAGLARWAIEWLDKGTDHLIFSDGLTHLIYHREQRSQATLDLNQTRLGSSMIRFSNFTTISWLTRIRTESRYFAHPPLSHEFILLNYFTVAGQYPLLQLTSRKERRLRKEMEHLRLLL